MVITARQTSTRIHAIRQLVAKLDALPLAVGEIHRAIEDGTINQRDDRPRAENAKGVQVSGYSDPTQAAALRELANHERHLNQIEDDLRDLARLAGDLCDVVTRWVVSAVNKEPHPRCGELTPREIKLEDWYHTPNRLGRVPVDCADRCGYDGFRDDGSPRYRADGLCDADRMARHRWLKGIESAA